MDDVPSFIKKSRLGCKKLRDARRMLYLVGILFKAKIFLFQIVNPQNHQFHFCCFGRYISSISSSVNPVVSGMKKKLNTIKPMVKHALMKNIPWTPSVSNQIGTDLVTTNKVRDSKKPRRPFPRDLTFAGNNSPYNYVDNFKIF